MQLARDSNGGGRDDPSSLSFPKSFGLENTTTKSLQELYYTETSKTILTLMHGEVITL